MGGEGERYGVRQNYFVKIPGAECAVATGVTVGWGKQIEILEPEAAMLRSAQRPIQR